MAPSSPIKLGCGVIFRGEPPHPHASEVETPFNAVSEMKHGFALVHHSYALESGRGAKGPVVSGKKSWLQ